MWMPTTTTTSSKSNLPNWLDKLWKVKGFPSLNDGHSLDHFLSQQPHHQLQKPNDDDRLHPRDSLPENDDMSTRMANVLSDLFSDGRSNNRVRSSNFKASRKQPNPRICVLPAAAAAAAAAEDKGSNDSDRVAAAAVVVDDDDRNLESKRKVRRGLKENEKDEERRRKLGDCDLVGFSRTEVTVIDSSNPLWKFDKYLFRKKNVWKARDCQRIARYNNGTKNGVGIGRKKKREAFVDDDDDDGDDEVVLSKKGKSFGARKLGEVMDGLVS